VIQTVDEPNTAAAEALVQRIVQDVCEAQDNSLAAKISQAEFANKHQSKENV